jgi:hypothetical protein
MNGLLQAITLAFGAVFVGGILYWQYALIRVEIDRRRKLGWAWVGFRLPWSTRDLTERGVAYQKRGLRALLVALAAFALINMVWAIAAVIARVAES